MQHTQIQMPKLTFVNKVLMAVSAGLFLLESTLMKLSGISLKPLLGLSAGTFSSGLVTSLVTYPFLGTSLMGVLFNCLLFWFIGCEFESSWGRKRYLSFLFASTITAGIVYLLISFIFFQGGPIYHYPLLGLQGMCSALCLAYAIIYPDRTFTFMLLFPMKAKYFCMIMIGIELYSGIFSPMGILAWGHLAAMVGGYFYMVMIANKAGGGASDSGQRGFFKKKKKTGHLSLVDKDEEKPPKYWQ